MLYAHDALIVDTNESLRSYDQCPHSEKERLQRILPLVNVGSEKKLGAEENVAGERKCRGAWEMRGEVGRLGCVASLLPKGCRQLITS